MLFEDSTKFSFTDSGFIYLQLLFPFPPSAHLAYVDQSSFILSKKQPPQKDNYSCLIVEAMPIRLYFFQVTSLL